MLAVASLGLLAACGRAATAPAPAATPACPAPAAATAPSRPAVGVTAVDLPKASLLTRVATTLVIGIDARGALSVNGQPVDDNRLRALAQAAVAHEPDVRAVISADLHVPWQSVVHALDLVKMSGIARVAFGVEAAPAPAPVATASAPPTLEPLAPAPAPAALASRARPKRSDWKCAFPKEADVDRVDDASVVVVVSVDAGGQATGARVLGTAPRGFGPAALRCAVSQAYEPATEGGAPVAAETPPIKVRFLR